MARNNERLGPDALRAMYGTRENYLREFEESLNEQEAAGGSLPVYHDLILEDAKAVAF